jgi:hypothetical protein
LPRTVQKSISLKGWKMVNFKSKPEKLYGLLEAMATYLNNPSPVWRGVENIISKVTDAPTRKEKRKQLVSAVRSFDELAQKYPMPLRIIQVGDDIEEQIKLVKAFPNESPTREMEVALRMLERAFFRGDGWERLKRCPQCNRWFIDTSRNKRKERCSKSCTDRWWSRDRRKEARHGKSLKQKAKSKERR